MYVKLKDNKPDVLVKKPNWFYSDGNPVNDDRLFISNNIYPVVDNPPKNLTENQVAVKKPLIEWSVYKDRVEVTYNIRNKDSKDLSLECRLKREGRLEKTLWIKERHEAQKALGITPTLTDAEYEQWLQYWQDLRDITEQEGFPDNVTWPVKPAVK